MFDPFSALGALGFITGNLGFIVSTLPKLDEKTRAFREYERSFRSLSGRLDVAYLDLRAWIVIWVGKEAFSDAFYIHLWGLKGLDDVKSRLNDIKKESEEVQKLLYWPEGASGEELQAETELKDWQESLTRRVLVNISSRPVYRIAIRKAIFALFRNDTIKDKIDGLEKSIEGLKKFTQLSFRLGHDSDPESKVTKSELRLLDQQLFVDRISKSGDSLYRNLANFSKFEWAVELSPPGAAHALDLLSKKTEMYVDFIVRPVARIGHIKARRLRINLEKVPVQTVDYLDYLDLVEQRIEDVFRGHDGPDFDSEHIRVFDVLENPTKRSRALKKLLTDGLSSREHRKNFEADRADLIYGLGHWMILLWNTPWLSDLCSCGIRCIHLADATMRHSFLSRPDAGHIDRDLDCHPPYLAGHRFELLGVTLAEIALALPISVQATGENTRFYVIGGEGTSREGLLEKLTGKCGLRTITMAVSYCLGLDSFRYGDSLPPDHLEQCCQKIILPLQAYHKIFSEHCQNRSGRLRRGDGDLSGSDQETNLNDLYPNTERHVAERPEDEEGEDEAGEDEEGEDEAGEDEEGEDEEGEDEEGDSSDTGSSFAEGFRVDDEDSFSHEENDNAEFSNGSKNVGLKD